MYIWVKQFDHSKILHKTCWAHLSTRQGFSTWTCGWAQRLVSTKLRYQMIPLPSFVHRRKSYRYDMIQSLPWLPTVSLVLCGRFYLRHFTEFHSVPCWSYFVCLCVCVQVLKKEKSLSKRTVWRIWSPKLSSLRDFKILQIQLLFCQDAFSGKLRFDTGSWWQVVKYTVRHSVQDRVRSGIVWDRFQLSNKCLDSWTPGPIQNCQTRRMGDSFRSWQNVLPPGRCSGHWHCGSRWSCRGLFFFHFFDNYYCSTFLQQLQQPEWQWRW